MSQTTLEREDLPLEGAREPRELALEAERNPKLPGGTDERFSGWGVMGLPFSSGEVLAMRRFTASSIGAAYTTVWHREPDGAWTIWTDRSPLESCPRYFGSALAAAVTTPIELAWDGPRALTVRVPTAGLSWELSLGSTSATRALNAMAKAMPEKAWLNPSIIGAMARMAGPMLRAGHLGLSGKTPNGQTFLANPMKLWIVERSTASLGGRNLGTPEPLPTQERLGDFWIPQRGLFVFGRSFFEPADPAKHPLITSRKAMGEA